MTTKANPQYGARVRTRPPRSRVKRFVNVGRMLARVYAGYKWVSFREKRKGAA